MTWHFIILTTCYKTKSVNHIATINLTKMLMQYERNQNLETFKYAGKLTIMYSFREKNEKQTW